MSQRGSRGRGRPWRGGGGGGYRRGGQFRERDSGDSPDYEWEKNKRRKLEAERKAAAQQQAGSDRAHSADQSSSPFERNAGELQRRGGRGGFRGHRGGPNPNRRRFSSSSSSSSSDSSSDDSSSSSGDEMDVSVPESQAPEVPATIVVVEQAQAQAPAAPKKKLSEVKQISGYYYDEVVDRYFRNPLPGAPGYANYQAVLKRQREAIEAEKRALLPKPISAPELASIRPPRFATVREIVCIPPERKGYTLSNSLIQMRQISTSAAATRASQRAFERIIASRQSAAAHITSVPFLTQRAVCSDMVLLPKGLLLDDQDPLSSAGILTGTSTGHVTLFQASVRGTDSVSFEAKWTKAFANEGGVSSVRPSTDPLACPFVSCTTWGGSAPGGLRLLNLISHVVTYSVLQRGSLWCHEWSPRSNIFSIGTEGGALLLDIESGKRSKIFTAKSDVFQQQFDSTGNILFNGTRDGKIKTVDIRQPPNRIPPSGSHFGIMQHKASIACMKILRDENFLISSSNDGVIEMWDRRVCRSVRSFSFPNKLSSVKFGLDPTQKYLSVAGTDSCFRVWNLHDSPTGVFANAPIFELPVSDYDPVGPGTQQSFMSASVCADLWSDPHNDTSCPTVAFVAANSLRSVPLQRTIKD